MNAVMLIALLGALVSGQPPLQLPGGPLPPLPPGPAPQSAPVDLPPLPKVDPGFPGLTPVDQKDILKPLVPVQPHTPGAPALHDHVGSPLRGDGTKPPPFKLIEINPPADSVSLKPAPTPSVLHLPPGTAATPCLVLLRTGPTAVKAGKAFAYEITVRNVGSVAAAQARLEDELPPGTRFVAAQPMPMVQEGRLTWNLENLAAGAERSFKVEVEAARDGDWKASATLTVSISSTHQASVTGAPAQPLSLSGPSTVPVGHKAPFTIRVTNTTAAPLTSLMLRVQLTPGLQHLHGDAIEGPLSDLAPGQTKELTLDAITTQTGRLSGDVWLLSGKSVVASGQVSVVVTEQATLTLRQTGPLSPTAGGEQEFKIEVANRGTSEVRDVQVSDILPSGLDYASSEVGGQYDLATRTIRWNVGVLGAGQSRQVAFRALVRAAGPQVNLITARASGAAEVQLNTILRVTAP